MSSEKSTQSEFRLLFKASAYQEFKAPDAPVKSKVVAQLLKMQANPLVGEPLGNRMDVDLTGFRRIYVGRKRTRIIWQVRASEVTVLVIGIGPCDKGEVYRTVARRLAGGK